ncbi:CBS domain-containing protein [Reyranella sp. CPCC 100927]|uniref:TerC family protein n=1 Tax=Reyranella sp. CPCC 100927 TaxID=2599616 RepID=UPI001C497E72|nr:CBS domain-containing protein [Reyranella sp. CPCC 100927]
MMAFDWMADPTAWFGLGTLVVLEIVLGIDNLVFIAILTDRLPPERRQKARLLGLGLALFMRLALLAGIAWIASLTAPLFHVLDIAFSGRDLILIGGGLFLLFKATTELHQRLEGAAENRPSGTAPAVFWQVIVQIVVLDAIFSLDSVITAVGMVRELSVMMTAVVIAVLVMMVASRPLMDFIGAHPTVVILCLGFLLMIGFSLAIEGVGFHIPKGYLYAAITFSILIEALNQIGRRNRRRQLATIRPRERAAAVVLRLLGSRSPAPGIDDAVAPLVAASDAAQVFKPQERAMVKSVIMLADQPAHSIMTPRDEVVWLDIEAPEADVRRIVLTAGRSRFPVARGRLDAVLGMALTRDMLAGLMERGAVDPARTLHEPVVVPDTASVLDVMERLRRASVQMALLVDTAGTITGLVTPDDILRAIADFPAAPTAG